MNTMNTLKDLPWRQWPKETPPAEGYYLTYGCPYDGTVPNKEDLRLLLWANGMWDRRRTCTADKEYHFLCWCPIIPINKDGSITLGTYARDNQNQTAEGFVSAADKADEAQELLISALAYCWGKEAPGTQVMMDRIQDYLHKCRTQEALAPEPLEIVYPRFSTDYVCRKCGNNSCGVHHEAGKNLLKISCKRCFFEEHVRPLDWQGKVLDAPPAPSSKPCMPTIHLIPLDRATHTCGWRATAGPHWAEGFIYGDALLNLLKMEAVQDYLGFNFEEHKP